MGFFDLFKRQVPTRRIARGPMPAKGQNEQAFVRGPGPGPGLHSAQYHIEPQLKAPAPPLHSMARAYGGQQSLITPIGVDDSQYHFSGFNNGGLGQLVNSQVAVQQIPVLQWSNAIYAPSRDKNVTMNPTRDIGGGIQAERYLELNLNAPIRPQSIPGYVVTQSQVINGAINATQVQMYRNLKAPRINETQSSMC